MIACKYDEVILNQSTTRDKNIVFFNFLLALKNINLKNKATTRGTSVLILLHDTHAPNT